MSELSTEKLEIEEVKNEKSITVTGENLTEQFVKEETKEVKEITLEEVKNYLRILDDNEDEELKLLINSAVWYVMEHTGLEEDVVRTKFDIRTALYILISDFYWNRDYQTGNKYKNRLVDNIIENNRTNFIV